MHPSAEIISKCQELLAAYKSGALGEIVMPEENSPTEFRTKEERLTYFTLPMALNYQRDSYTMWKSALETYQDEETYDVFDLAKVASMDRDVLQHKLLKHKLALQPNKHTETWSTISATIFSNWKSIDQFLNHCDYDYLIIRNAVQLGYKKGFPYLSGPKIFNYWSYIMGEYGGVELKNREYIDIAPDTHVTKCSVLLGVISQDEATQLSKEEISARWRVILEGSGIAPIEMHSPLWFWSRNGFRYALKSHSKSSSMKPQKP